MKIEKIEKKFSENNLKLLEKEYLGKYVPLQYECSCGNLDEVTWGSFCRRKYKETCKSCRWEKVGKDPSNNQNKRMGYWKNWDNVKKELEQRFPGLINQGIFPTFNMLREHGIDGQLMRNHGTLASISKKMNCKILSSYLTRDHHTVRSYAELILDEYLYSRDIQHVPEVKIGNYRCDQKIGKYYIEIWGYTNSNHPLAKEYNNKRLLKEKYYHENNLDLISIEREQLTRSFNDAELFLNDMFANLGFCVDKIINFDVNVLNEIKGSFWSEDKIVNELQIMWDTNGIFPNIKKIKMVNGLFMSLYDYGGLKYFKEKMNVPEQDKTIKWTQNKILEDLRTITLKKGKFPYTTELPSDLKHAIYRMSKKLKINYQWYRAKIEDQYAKQTDDR